jgi:hypothetical protein
VIAARPVLRHFDLFDRILDHGIFAHTPKVTACRGAGGASVDPRNARCEKRSCRRAA